MKLRSKICRLYHGMKRRCEDLKHDKYKYYGGKGIKVRMTIEELEELWEACEADSLNHPSINRIDPSKDYTFQNCEFIEKNFNKHRNHSEHNIKMTRVLKDFGMSYKEISKRLNMPRETVSKIVRGEINRLVV